MKGLFVTSKMFFSPSSHRAPEVILGLPITVAADMWSLGIVLATLYFASVPFPQRCHYYLVCNLMHLICLNLETRCMLLAEVI